MNKAGRKRIIHKRRGTLVGIAFVVVVLCCVIQYGKIDLDTKEKESQKKLEELQKKYAEEEKRSEEIEDYAVYVQSKQFIEEQAREKLGLAYPDEIIFEAEEE